MSSLAASAYIVHLHGELSDDEDPIAEVFVVATDLGELARRFARDAPDDRFVELLRRGLVRQLAGEYDEPFSLRLLTVQRGALASVSDLRPHVKLGGATLERLSEAVLRHDLPFVLEAPRVDALVPPKLAAGDSLAVIAVPDELEDMTDLVLGETQVSWD